MSAKNIGQSQIVFVTTAKAELLYVKPHARKPSFPGPVTPSATEQQSGENNSPSSWESCSSPLAETIAATLLNFNLEITGCDFWHRKRS